MRESQLRGRSRLRQLKQDHLAPESAMDQQRERFAKLADPSAKPRAVSSFNLFQTPQSLAARMAEMIPQGGRVLEPSAGLGRLYRAVRARAGSPIVLVEQSADCCRELFREIEGDTAAKLVQADFLECDAKRLGGLFDAIVMNPPFKMGRDIKHILHARTLLKPGGLLVGLCFAGSRQQSKLRPLVDSWEDLPPDTFKSEGTRAQVAMVTLNA